MHRSVLHGNRSGKSHGTSAGLPRDQDQFVFHSCGNGSAFCGYPAEAGQIFTGVPPAMTALLHAAVPQLASQTHRRRTSDDRSSLPPAVPQLESQTLSLA